MNSFRVAVSACLLTFAVTASAGETKQNHHCKMADGTVDATKTKAECKTAKGKWAKDAPADAAAKPADGTTPPPAAK
ncbi:MAG TPA: hypothetical protein VIA18_25200 [Polyangia bacterium]|jgi:hypothetical protein|nr:hypothetical protein [Polyangia bacterium]